MQIPVIKKLVELYSLAQLQSAEEAMLEEQKPAIEVEGKDEGDDLVGFKLVFKEDGTCKSAEYHTDKWDWFDEGKWSYSNGIITITDNNESELIKVKTLTDSQLIIETTDKYTEDGIFYEDYELTEYRKI